MFCPYCGTKCKVVEIRQTPNSSLRQIRCKNPECKKIIYTKEQIVTNVDADFFDEWIYYERKNIDARGPRKYC